MIAEVLVGLEINKSFDYEFEGNTLEKGMRVLVDFAGRERVGFVIGIKKSSVHKNLKPILKVLDNLPCFIPQLIEFSRKISQHYLYSQGEILEMMLPVYLRKKRILKINPQSVSSQKSKKIKTVYLREEIVKNKRFNYYQEVVRENLKNNKKVIICVPQKEEAFIIKDFLEHSFDSISIALLFGSDRASTQFEEWLKIREGRVQVCIGTRFAIFSPFNNLGAIIVEKENFFGYFQPEKPFYHLRDLALMRAKIDRADLILHSDFPSLEVYELLRKRRVTFINMFEDKNPKIKIFNLGEYKSARLGVFSGLGLELIRSYLDKQKKVIIFYNRKGLANILRCNLCNQIIKCPRCGGFLSFSLEKNYFCRHCQYKDKEGKFHPCSKGYIRKIGVGLERLWLDFQRIFPGKKIVRLSRDEPIQEDWDILISTQKIVFLKEPPSAELVIIWGVDSLLSWGDYNSSLELYYLIERLKGIAKEEFIIFTYHPSYYVFEALKKDWQWFYKKELKERKLWELPPYFRLAKISLRAKNQKSLLKKVEALKILLEKEGEKLPRKPEIYGPLKERLWEGKSFYSLVVKAHRYYIINKILNKALARFKKSTAKLSLIIN